MEIEEFDDLVEKLEKGLSKAQGKTITRSHVFDALLVVLGDSFGEEHPVGVWDIDISYDEALEALKQFDFGILADQFEADLDINRDLLFQTKVKINANGHQIIIHRYDQDPFPSNPHGHIIDQNLKIDLSNGECYRNRNLVYTLGKKKLLEIREKARNRYKGDLPSLKI